MATLKKMIIFTAFLCGFVGGAFAQSLKSESIYLICKGKVTYLHEYSSGKIEANTFEEEEALTLITSNSNGKKTNVLKFKGEFYDEGYYSYEDQPRKPMMWGRLTLLLRKLEFEEIAVMNYLLQI